MSRGLRLASMPFIKASSAFTILKPLRFGPSGRQLLGLLHAPLGTLVRGHTVLLCNPFGQEAIRCHRLLRVLAERLARAGFHVMRFDYLGTGDSDGDEAQADWSGWMDDVLRANTESLRWSGNPRSSWFGLRLGATLAALASSRADPAPQLLVLWDPVLSGAHYLQELAQAHAAELKALHGNPHKRYSADEADGVSQVLGFALGPALLEPLRHLNVEALATARADKVQFITGPNSQNTVQNTAALAQTLLGRGAAVDTLSLQTHIVWASDEAMNSAIVPAEPFAAILQAFMAEAA
jgi:uncharacterized protein